MLTFKNWDQVKGVLNGRGKLPPGGHVCKIIKVEQKIGRNGGTLLSLWLDIDEGSQHDGRGMEEYTRRVNAGKNAFFPYIMWINVYGENMQPSPYFKGLILQIEQDNPPYKWDGDEDNIVGKKVGAVFREKELAGVDGNFFVTEPFAFCPVQDAPSVTPPEPLRINSSPNRFGNLYPFGDEMPF